LAQLFRGIFFKALGIYFSKDDKVRNAPVAGAMHSLYPGEIYPRLRTTGLDQRWSDLLAYAMHYMTFL